MATSRSILNCLVLIVIVNLFVSSGLCDLPCNVRDVGIPGRSIVCVCNSTYCDTITRVDPEPGTYVIYTSSNAGQRFEKNFGTVQSISGQPEDDDPDDGDINDEIYEDSGIGSILESIWNNVEFRIFPTARHQYIEGFGGSVTDAASINWRKLSDETQTKFIESYFGPEGLEYNMIRVPIAGCDFSTHPYTYNEEPWYDAALSNYSLTEEDLFYKLPMIKRSQQVATDEIKITASTWSPPIWMKTNERITGFGQLKPEYFQTYADYHIRYRSMNICTGIPFITHVSTRKDFWKFILERNSLIWTVYPKTNVSDENTNEQTVKRFLEEYEKAEVQIWAITTTNEPLNGIIPLARFNSLGITPSQLGRFVANNLGPRVRNSRFNKTLILAVDDQRYIIPTWIRGMEREDPKSIEYIDGIAIHYYGNMVPGAILTRVQEQFPDKILLSTEACEGPMPWDLLKVEIGSWRRARRYITSILEDLNNFVVGWIDWNLCLDPNGGPNWANNFVDSPILVYGDDDEFIKQPMFYAMGHFSKFIPRGSRRIRSSRRSVLSVENLAVIKPNGNIVIVLQNRRTREMNIKIQISTRTYIEFKMEPESVKTIEVNPN